LCIGICWRPRTADPRTRSPRRPRTLNGVAAPRLSHIFHCTAGSRPRLTQISPLRGSARMISILPATCARLVRNLKPRLLICSRKVVHGEAAIVATGGRGSYRRLGGFELDCRMVFASSMSGARAGPQLSSLRVRQQAYSFLRLAPAVIAIDPPDYVASYSGKYGSGPKQTDVLQSVAGEIPPLPEQPGNDGD